jgi:hypothetical protein
MKKIKIIVLSVVVLLGVLILYEDYEVIDITHNNKVSTETQESCLEDKDGINRDVSDNKKNIGYVSNFRNYAYSCALETFYSDDKYDYMFPSIKSSYIEVEYKDGTKENVVEALNKGNINISDLDKYGIDYIKELKSIG